MDVVNAKSMLILGTLPTGATVIGTVGVWVKPNIDLNASVPMEGISKDANNFVAVRDPALFLELPDPHDARKIHVGLRSVHMTIEVDEWFVKLIGYVKLDVKKHEKLIKSYEEFVQQERASRAGLTLPRR